MKLLENAKLDGVSAALCVDTGDSKITCRVESYSCNMAGSYKKLYKQQLSHPAADGQAASADRLALSPPQTFVGSPVVTVGSPLSPGGIPAILIRSQSGGSTAGMEPGGGPQFCDTICSKTLFYLRSTLTAAFQPDYDFTDAKSEEFSLVPSVKWVVDAVRSNLSAAAGDMFISFESQLWETVDGEIKLAECDIYSYNPDLNSDPYCEEGALWSFNYFFYNKKLKRILFFSCSATSPSAETGELLEDEFVTEDMEFEPNFDDSAYESFSSAGADCYHTGSKYPAPTSCY